MIVTPSQTVGPYFKIGLIDESWTHIVAPGAGPLITIAGVVLDANGKPVPDSMLEIWQADRNGFGRFGVDPADGTFSFETVLPAGVRQPDGQVHAGHLNVGVFARGLLKRLHTRIYFEGESMNATDPILSLVPEQRRATLIARPTDATRTRFSFDVRLAGPGETVFFEC